MNSEKDPSSLDTETMTVRLPRLMTQQQVAELTQKSPKTLERMRWLGEGPPWVKLGRHVRYRASDVQLWIESNLQQPQSDV